MFWICLICFIIGLIVGCAVGLFAMGLCVAANIGDRIFIDE